MMQTFLFRMLNNDDTEWLHTQWETYGFQPPTNNQHFSLNKYRKNMRSLAMESITTVARSQQQHRRKIISPFVLSPEIPPMQ